jgi:hypothetical protein
MARQYYIDENGAIHLTASSAGASRFNPENILFLPIHFDTEVSREPMGMVVPPNFIYAQVIYQGTNGTAATLTMSKIYSTGSVAMTTTKANISEFTGIGVIFQAAITGGTKASFLVEFTKE